MTFSEILAYANPFRHLFEVTKPTTTTHPEYYNVHAHFLRSTFSGKVSATLEAFFGNYSEDKKKAHRGLLDYPFFLLPISEMLLRACNDSIKNKYARFFAKIFPYIFFIVFRVLKLILAPLLTLATLPITLIFHGMSLLAGGYALKRQIAETPIKLTPQAQSCLNEKKSQLSYDLLLETLQCSRDATFHKLIESLGDSDKSVTLGKYLEIVGADLDQLHFQSKNQNTFRFDYHIPGTFTEEGLSDFEIETDLRTTEALYQLNIGDVVNKEKEIADSPQSRS